MFAGSSDDKKSFDRQTWSPYFDAIITFLMDHNPTLYFLIINQAL